ncbi:hypothetical protein DCAR_0207212 [Daucus carota subsp. sativus]|uniref:Uncharacterized protein n=1 Tax=Daucus carota subsp. sativus TaxID=79200 RepID=A0A166DQV4_DAUCS|nr:hypothetical protein DCAR_0207212 [Daucus carota subsp. sativus]
MQNLIGTRVNSLIDYLSLKKLQTCQLVSFKIACARHISTVTQSFRHSFEC